MILGLLSAPCTLKVTYCTPYILSFSTPVQSLDWHYREQLTRESHARMGQGLRSSCNVQVRSRVVVGNLPYGDLIVSIEYYVLWFVVTVFTTSVYYARPWSYHPYPGYSYSIHLSIINSYLFLIRSSIWSLFYCYASVQNGPFAVICSFPYFVLLLSFGWYVYLLLFGCVMHSLELCWAMGLWHDPVMVLCVYMLCGSFLQRVYCSVLYPCTFVRVNYDDGRSRSLDLFAQVDKRDPHSMYFLYPTYVYVGGIVFLFYHSSVYRSTFSTVV